MAASHREKVMLLSTGKTQKQKPTGTYYTSYKNKQKTPNKLELSKYDPLAYNSETGRSGMHVKFVEKKLPKSSK